MKTLILLLFNFIALFSFGQSAISGQVFGESGPLPFAVIRLLGGAQGVNCDENGRFELMAPLPLTIEVSALGYKSQTKNVEHLTRDLKFRLQSAESALNEVVVSGSLRQMTRLQSIVPVEVYRPSFFNKNPTPNIYEALQQVNGLRPQLNCQVCNTGDIHINGMEGAYTMVLIDGMPLVSSLSTVYGLMGIPTSLIERVEVVKGPAGSIYGSESMGGVINVITRSPSNAPRFSLENTTTSWGESNTDLALKHKLGSKIDLLTGINYFKFGRRVDKNQDGFTDIALQDRLGIFQKYSFQRNRARELSLGLRYFYEDRWGGQSNWSRQWRGSDVLYGESIYTNRAELFGSYQLPLDEKILFTGFLNSHRQNSYYGTTPFMAIQNIGFAQLAWYKDLGKHKALLGSSYRFTQYDDNTPATSELLDIGVVNRVRNTPLPGLFIQDEYSLNNNMDLLLGYRLDHHPIHGFINTPRAGIRISNGKSRYLRLNTGTGFRVVNVFTEDHAALTGARNVVVADKLRPERSVNFNVNYLWKYYYPSGAFLSTELGAFYTHFSNKIIPDYTRNANEIFYDNLMGYAINRGLLFNLNWEGNKAWKLNFGASYMDNLIVEEQHVSQQLLSERFTATWTLSYIFARSGLSLDYTGNLYSPMQLPTLGELDPRKDKSPWWSIQNLQLSKKMSSSLELFGGVKNLLNWTPARNNPFLIARSQDPFDKQVEYDAKGNVLSTAQNPYALSFDAAYVYAPNQGRRFFIGFRWTPFQ